MSVRPMWRSTFLWVIGGLVATCAACSVPPSAVSSAPRPGLVSASAPESPGSSPASSTTSTSASAESHRPTASASTSTGHPTTASPAVLAGAAAPRPCGFREPAGTPPAESDPNYPAAVQLARAELPAAPALPGSVLVPRTPSPEIAQGQGDPLRATTVCATRWYTAPGTPAHALAVLGRKLHGGNPGRYLTGPGTRVDYLRDRDVQIGVTAVGRGVGIVVVVQVQWNRTRPESTKLGKITGPVDIDITRTTMNPQPTHAALPPLHRTLSGPAAQRLASMLDALPLEPYAMYSCPPADGPKIDRLAFRSEHGPVIVSVEVNGCSGISVSPASGPSVRLEMNAATGLDRWLITELGLPHKYLMYP